MTEAAKTIIQVASAFSAWVSSHMNIGGELIRQIVPLGIAFGFIHMTPEQQSVLFSSVSGIVAVITGANIVSKVRFGERVDEKVAEKVAQITTGSNG